MDPTRLDPRPRRASLTVTAISLALANPLASSLSLADVAALARTCRALKHPGDLALVRCVSFIPPVRSGGETVAEEGVRLSSTSTVDSFAQFLERWGVGVGQGRNIGEESIQQAMEGGGLAACPGPPSADDIPTLRPRQLTLHIHQLSSSISLLKILHICASTLAHLRISYAEHLLTQEERIYDALASLSNLTSLVIHSVGPRGCAFLKSLKSPLEHVEVEFADDWVLSVLGTSLQQPATRVSFNGGLPTPTPTPVASPAADAVVLPDPISLLANGMQTLRTLRASNAIIVTVADKLRYPRVKTLALRLAGVPTVTPLVHAFPALAELYVYTPYDGCGVRAPDLPATECSKDYEGEEEPMKKRLRAPMPSIHDTREANCTSQLYSSFPPLACVRGFVPGLYALGLTCAVRHVEIGRLAPPSEGTEETRAVQKVLVDAKPTSVTLGLGRGWWAEGQMTVVERESQKARGKRRRKSGAKEGDERKVRENEKACSGRRKEREKETARDALKSIFGGSMGNDEVWAGVTDLVLRVEEPGNWKHVTRDILAMLLPLTNTLATFVLHWDRTSVPFDRIPHDDGYEDPDGDIPMYSCPDSHPLSKNDAATLSLSRAEAFARYTGEQSPALRYVLLKILHDDRPPAAAPNLSPVTPFWSAPPPAPPQLAPPLCESRFFHIGRDGGWLYLDTLPAGVAEQVMAAGGLSFADRVRYY